MLVAAPIRSSGVQQLEVLQVGRVGDVRSAAEVDEGSVGVGGDDLVVRKLAQALQLERIVRKPLLRLLL